MNKKSILYRVGFNTLVQFSGKIISVVLGFLTVGLLTRYLGTSRYGDFTLVFAYMSFFGVFADFGLQLAIVRELSQKSISAEKIYGTYFWIKLALIVASTALALILLIFFPYSSSLKIGIVIGALAVGIGGLSGYGTAIFQSKIRLDLVTYIDILSRLVSVVLILLFIYIKLNFYYIVSTVLIGNFAAFLATVYLLKRDIKFDFKYDPELAKKIVKWSIPIGLTSFFSLAYFKIDTIMLSIMKGSTDVGIYSLSYKILENILMLWGLYMASVYPLMAKFKGDSEQRNVLGLLKSSSLIAISLSFFIILLGFIFAPIIVNIFGGLNFGASVVPFKILLFSLPIFFINNILYNFYLVERKVKFIIMGLLFTLAINFSLNVFFISKYSYVGAAYVTIISEVALLLFYLSIVFLSRTNQNYAKK